MEVKMNESLAICFPAAILLLVVSGYLVTVFEPYFAQKSAEGLELKQYHAQDLKLKLIAQFWAAKLTNEPDGWYDASNESARRLFEELHEALVRHRFLFGDDPKKLRYEPSRSSPLLQRAIKRANWNGRAVDSQVMTIYPNLVMVDGERVIWRGRPQAYKSRFKDMYDSYAQG
jgi:hypothetical protein